MKIKLNKDYLTLMKSFGFCFVLCAGLTTPVAISMVKNSPPVEEDTFTGERRFINDIEYCEVEAEFTNEDLFNLSSEIEVLQISKNSYINDLSKLPDICPNLNYLILDNDINITNFDFVKKLSNLEHLSINDSPYITEALVDYCHKNNIIFEYDQKQLEYSKQLDEIINNIITPDMSDTDKIYAISSYVAEEYTYDEDYTFEGNITPIGCMLENKRGVCTSFSTLTDCLLTKCGIESYVCFSNDHAWNIIKINDMYYYLDVTNIRSNNTDALYNFLFKNLRKSSYFMSNPSITNNTILYSYDSTSVNIPEEIQEDIRNGEDLKNIFEKYHNTYPEIVALLALTVSLTGASIGSIATLITLKL